MTEEEARIRRQSEGISVWRHDCGWDPTKVGKRLGWLEHDVTRRLWALSSKGIEALNRPIEETYAAMDASRAAYGRGKPAA
ncbi:hypothetical protein GCM10020369_78080 [Cryptosporangium minutisporangium]|uniref:Helix-turn-helix DNA binding domain protein n=1 Tax=Cryptosporangium minutisporangium TaxID=113569 RepID=A0ABP6TBM7_9ACTN